MKIGLVTVVRHGDPLAADCTNSGALHEYNVFLFRLLSMKPAPISGSFIFITFIRKHRRFPLILVEF